MKPDAAQHLVDGIQAIIPVTWIQNPVIEQGNNGLNTRKPFHGNSSDPRNSGNFIVLTPENFKQKGLKPLLYKRNQL